MRSAKNKFRLIVTLLMIFMMSSFATGVYAADQTEQVIKITAKKFEYSPNEIRIKKGVPVVLEFTSLDRLHGFNCPDLGVRATIEPEKVTRLRIVAPKAGTYEFHCDIFCGDGHEDMTGKIIVEE
jgi:cytochrome c oxidase subunit 2